MTRHSLGYLLSERAKAQKQFIPIPVDTTEPSLQSDTMVEKTDIVQQDEQKLIHDEIGNIDTVNNTKNQEQHLTHHPDHTTQQ